MHGGSIGSFVVSDIQDNLARIKANMAQALAQAGRNNDDAQLIAVSKTNPVEAIQNALKAGQRVFGENRVQEAALKFPALRDDYPDLKLHLIGPLQTNKVRDAVALFDVIHTLDRPKLARALADEMRRVGKMPDLLLQVNTGLEAQKAGVAPDQAETLLKIAQDYGLPVIGLMCIPPVDQDPSPHFAMLRQLGAKLGLKTLSMGMSDDYPVALEHGANLIRVGSAIFGARNYPA